MTKPFDVTSKHLFESHPRDWLSLLGWPVPPGLFPPDVTHMRAVLNHFDPKVFITFGRSAAGGYDIAKLGLDNPVQPIHLAAPHPSARGSSVTTELKDVAIALSTWSKVVCQ